MNDNFKQDLKRRLTSRKLQVTVVGFVSATVFFYIGILPPDLWVDLTKWVFAVYVAGNSFEHFTNQGIKIKTSSSNGE